MRGRGHTLLNTVTRPSWFNSGEGAQCQELIVLDPWITAVGLAVLTGGKLWFLDRMALLYDDAGGVFGAAGPGTPRKRPELKLRRRR
jgi:hypothetical protein